VPNHPRLVVFKLGGKEKLPATTAPDSAPVPLPVATGTPEQIAQGRALFGRYCQVCHGASAAGGGGVLPNLQRSGALGSADGWKSILIDGALKDQGMVSFARVLTPDQAQLIRYYVIDEAHWAQKNLNTDGAAPVAPAR